VIKVITVIAIHEECSCPHDLIPQLSFQDCALRCAMTWWTGKKKESKEP